MCTLVIAIPIREAHAFLGFFYAEAKIKTESEFIAGLDEPTRKLIAAMPETVRKEMVELLRQGLPLVEKSMRDFINDLDTRLESRINQLVCSGQAVGQGVAEEIKGVIVRQRPTPVRELMDGYDGRGKTFRPESARSIAIDYEDFLQQAGLTACRLVADGGTQRVEDTRVEARQKWRTWTEIEKECTTPADCMTKRYAKIRDLLAKADPRDVEKAQAKVALADVRLIEPQRGLWARTIAVFGFDRWAASSAEWLAYEPELVKLRTIERSVSAATALRTTLAKRYLTDAKAAVLTAEQTIEKAKAKLSDSVASVNTAAKTEALAAVKDKVELVTQFDQSTAGDSSLQEEAEAYKKRLQELRTVAASIGASADTKNKVIADAAAEAARQAKIRQREIDEFIAERAERRMPR